LSSDWRRRYLLVWVVLALVASICNPFVSFASTTTSTTEPVSSSKVEWFSDYITITEEDLQPILDVSQVESAVRHASSGNLYLSLKSGEHYKVEVSSTGLSAYLKANGVEITSTSFVEEKPKKPEGSGSSGLDTLVGCQIALAVILLFCAVLFVRNNYKKQPVALSLGGDKLEANEGVPNVKFSDVEGIEELMQDVNRLVDCLKNPDKYARIGARTPKGVILYGPPGTGKTLIAKAIAGEAGVPFLSAVGSDFVEKYVGVGASRVRDLYKKAKKLAPCIVFIDEIDAVAGQRGRGENTERDQTINALLAELDGFKSSDSVITICATNRLDMLDSAFKRAGRFDLKLAVGLPDRDSRLNILKIHSRDKLLDDSVSLEQIATRTRGFCGAELEALLNEAAMTAVTKGHSAVKASDIDDAFFKIVMQGNKKRRTKITDTNRIVAWHEAGHTLASKLLTDDSVSSVTIVGSASGAGGVTFRASNEDNELQSRKYLESTIMIMYAGRAAEELYFGNQESVTVGASQDIKQATSIIKDYLGLYGMGNKGMLDLSQFSNEYLSVIDEAAKMADKLYTDVLQLLTSNRGTLERLASALLEKETLEEPEIDEIIQGLSKAC